MLGQREMGAFYREGPFSIVQSQRIGRLLIILES